MVALAVICVLAIGGAIAYFVNARASVQAEISTAPAVARTSDIDAVLAEDHVVFRSTALGDSYGKLSVVTLADPSDGFSAEGVATGGRTTVLHINIAPRVRPGTYELTIVGWNRSARRSEPSTA